MLPHFQLQDLKTEGMSVSVLIALQRCFDSPSWRFRILRVYLHDVVNYPNHSQPFVCWHSLSPAPRGAGAQGHAGTAAVRRDEGRCWNAMTHSSCSQSSEAGLGVAAPRVPHVHSIPWTQHSLSRYVPAVSPGQRPPLPWDTWQPLLMARSILCRLKCQATRMIHPEMYAFSLFLSFFLSFPLNPTAAKEETMPFVNTDGTTLLLRQICG